MRNHAPAEIHNWDDWTDRDEAPVPAPYANLRHFGAASFALIAGLALLPFAVIVLGAFVQ